MDHGRAQPRYGKQVRKCCLRRDGKQVGLLFTTKIKPCIRSPANGDYMPLRALSPLRPVSKFETVSAKREDGADPKKTLDLTDVSKKDLNHFNMKNRRQQQT